MQLSFARPHYRDFCPHWDRHLAQPDNIYGNEVANCLNTFDPSPVRHTAIHEIDPRTERQSKLIRTLETREHHSLKNWFHENSGSELFHALQTRHGINRPALTSVRFLMASQPKYCAKRSLFPLSIPTSRRNVVSRVNHFPLTRQGVWTCRRFC